MIRMGFFLTLTVAVLLTSLTCSEAVPTDKREMERLFDRILLKDQRQCPYCVVHCCPPSYCQASGCRPP
uniref:Conotoxin Am6.8 n=1 Tax=Conus amadis TaxID=198732 RepID=CU68_CONAA